MPEELWKWAGITLAALTAVVGGAWAQTHRRISHTHRRIDRVEDEFRSDIRKGFQEASEGRGRIWQGLNDHRKELKEDLQKMGDRIVREINGGRE